MKKENLFFLFFLFLFLLPNVFSFTYEQQSSICTVLNYTTPVCLEFWHNNTVLNTTVIYVNNSSNCSSSNSSVQFVYIQNNTLTNCSASLEYQLMIMDYTYKIALLNKTCSQTQPIYVQNNTCSQENNCSSSLEYLKIQYEHEEKLAELNQKCNCTNQPCPIMTCSGSDNSLTQADCDIQISKALTDKQPVSTNSKSTPIFFYFVIGIIAVAIAYFTFGKKMLSNLYGKNQYRDDEYEEAPKAKKKHNPYEKELRKRGIEIEEDNGED